jgi:hypothetical protein
MSHAFLLRHLADWLMICGLRCRSLSGWAGGLGDPLSHLLQDPASHDMVALVHALGSLLVDAVVAVWALAVGAGLILLVAKRGLFSLTFGRWTRVTAI